MTARSLIEIHPPSRPTPGLSLLPPDTGHGRDLFHPRRDLAFVDVVHGFELHAPRRLAHPHRRHRRHRLERRAVDEHELDVAGEAAAAEAPAVADAIVRHAPLHGALQAGQRLGRQGIDTFGDAALRLRQAGDVGKTGLSPTAAFAGLALPVMASGSVVATSPCASVRSAVFRTAGLEVLSALRAGMVGSSKPRTFSPCSLFGSTKSYLSPARASISSPFEGKPLQDQPTASRYYPCALPVLRAKNLCYPAVRPSDIAPAASGRRGTHNRGRVGMTYPAFGVSGAHSPSVRPPRLSTHACQSPGPLRMTPRLRQPRPPARTLAEIAYSSRHAAAGRLRTTGGRHEDAVALRRQVYRLDRRRALLLRSRPLQGPSTHDQRAGPGRLRRSRPRDPPVRADFVPRVEASGAADGTRIPR